MINIISFNFNPKQQNIEMSQTQDQDQVQVQVPIQVIGIKYSGSNKIGDFYWMCMREEFSNSLFIFNDNEECHNKCNPGAGNAIMRQFNKHSDYAIPMSAGIPTGTLNYGGYSKLNTRTKSQIDSAFDEIIKLVNRYKYTHIYYSAELDGMLGTSIFEVNRKVLKYITARLFGLSNFPVQIIKTMRLDHFDNFEDDDDNANETK